MMITKLVFIFFYLINLSSANLCKNLWNIQGEMQEMSIIMCINPKENMIENNNSFETSTEVNNSATIVETSTDYNTTSTNYTTTIAPIGNTTNQLPTSVPISFPTDSSANSSSNASSLDPIIDIDTGMLPNTTISPIYNLSNLTVNNQSSSNFTQSTLITEKNALATTNSSLEILLIAGIVTASLVLIMIIIFTVHLYLKYKKLPTLPVDEPKKRDSNTRISPKGHKIIKPFKSTKSNNVKKESRRVAPETSTSHLMRTMKPYTAFNNSKKASVISTMKQKSRNSKRNLQKLGGHDVDKITNVNLIRDKTVLNKYGRPPIPPRLPKPSLQGVTKNTANQRPPPPPPHAPPSLNDNKKKMIIKEISGKS